MQAAVETNTSPCGRAEFWGDYSAHYLLGTTRLGGRVPVGNTRLGRWRARTGAAARPRPRVVTPQYTLASACRVAVQPADGSATARAPNRGRTRSCCSRS